MEAIYWRSTSTRRGLAERGLQDAKTAGLIGKGHVDEQNPADGRDGKSRIKLLGSVVAPMTKTFFLEVMPSISARIVSIQGSYTENRPGQAGAVKLTSQELVDDTVRCAASVTHGSTTSLSDGVQLVKEDDAKGSSAGLVENVADVALRLTEPHGEQLGSLHRNEVGSAFVGDSLRQHSLTGTRRTVEQNTTGRREAELEEFLGVIHGVLDGLHEILLDGLETTDVVPADVGNLDNGDLAQGGGLDTPSAKRKFSMVTPRESRTSASMVSSSRSMRSIFSRICCMAASEQRAARSEPT